MYRIAAVSFSILCIAATTVFAGGAGDCVTPIKTTTKYVGVGAAFEYNYVDERMEDLENKWGPRAMKLTDTNQIYGKLIIGVCDYVNLYGKIGGGNYKLSFVDTPQDATMVIKLKDGLYTGCGFNGLYPVMKVGQVDLGIGGDMQANYSLNDVKSITRSSEVGQNPSGSFYRIDGQTSLYLTGKYEIEKWQTAIIGYIGGYQSWAVCGTQKGLYYTTPSAGYIDKENYQAGYDFTSFGVMVGLDLDVAKYVNLNIEGRFIGETALTTGATVKF
jgi:hypothetical protein